MAKKQTVTAINGGAVMIPIEDLYPRPDNGRQRYDKNKLKGLAASMKTAIAQALLVRPRAEGGYEIVTGWRRWMAGKIAKLTHLPCNIREMTDDEAAWHGAIENLQREPLDPIDEAIEFARLLTKSKSPKDLASRLGQDVKLVTRRLPLADLIDDVVADLRAGHISLGHALEIARLPQDVQVEALNECYGYDWQDGEKVMIKEELDLTVEELRQWIERNLMLDLDRAPFKLDDERLRDDGLTCLKCPQRTGHNRMLFDDLSGDKDLCLNRDCFANKASAFIKLEALRIKKKGCDEPAPIISYNWHAAPDGMLSRNQFIEQASKERCETAERAVWGDGPEFGATTWICRSIECPTHARRADSGASTNGVSSNGVQSSGLDNKLMNADRLQQRLNMKADEATRREVFRQAVLTYTYPLSREMFNELAFSSFKRLSGHHQKTIEEVLKIETITEEVVAAMSDDQLAGFMAFHTFVHHGANEHFNRQVSQRGVVALAKDRGVNHKLIDAQKRIELSPKKYLQQHQLYIQEVEAGKDVLPPNVYGGSPFSLSWWFAPDHAPSAQGHEFDEEIEKPELDDDPIDEGEFYEGEDLGD